MSSSFADLSGNGLGVLFTDRITNGVAPEDVLEGVESIAINAGPAIRRILAAGYPLLLRKGEVYIVEPDPDSALGGGEFAWSIKVPSNAVIIGEGGLIKQADNAPSWCRTVSFQSSTNVRVIGTLRVDGNVDNINPDINNEHMHCVFLYNTTNFHIDAIEAVNARGDCVYIGGDDNTRGTCDGYIGRTVCATAGRKCLVWHTFDNIHMNSVFLNNTAGGAALYGGIADSTDGDCFDVEPDNNDGTVRNYGKIDTLYTKGAGNDFAAGITPVQAANVVVEIGSFVSEIVSRAGVPPLVMNAITMVVGRYEQYGASATSPFGRIQYSARAKFGFAKIEHNLADYALYITAVNTAGVINRPQVEFSDLQIINSLGEGLRVVNAQVAINDQYVPETLKNTIWSYSTLSTGINFADVSINRIVLKNVGQPTGAGYCMLASKGGTDIAYLHIGQLVHTDSRSPDNNSIVYIGNGNAAGVTIDSVINRTTAVPLFQWAGTDTWAKVGNNFFCNGSPEGLIAAPVGSIAQRQNGTAGSIVYAKSSGTGNAGWTGLS